MERRSAAVEHTRQAILEATMRCHARQGILATSVQDVAREADVALGTVYRHFPTLNDLVSACGQASLASLGLPDDQEAKQRFDGARSHPERIARLVDAVASLYQPAAKSFLAVRDAADALPAAAQGHKRMEHAIDSLVEEALRPLPVSANQRRTVRALLDARFWETLTEHGLDAENKRDELNRLLTCALR
ncbi:MAG: TetR/AcrR family transcriptional regulator [Solirubrobacteraceae bacterium]